MSARRGMVKPMKPMRDWDKYTHGCRQCVYQGTGTVEGEQTDWYLCGRTPVTETVLGRYGDAPHEYWSMPVSMLQSASDHGSTHATAALYAISGKRRPKEGAMVSRARCPACGFILWFDENMPGLCTCRVIGPRKVPRKSTTDVELVEGRANMRLHEQLGGPEPDEEVEALQAARRREREDGSEPT